MTRFAGVDVRVVNLTITDSGRICLSFYVTTYNAVLSADSLETLLSDVSTLNATLSQNGVIIVQVYRPNKISTATDQLSGGSTNHQVVLLGVLLAIAGAVILIGALVCVIIVR